VSNFAGLKFHFDTDSDLSLFFLNYVTLGFYYVTTFSDIGMFVYIHLSY